MSTDSEIIAIQEGRIAELEDSLQFVERWAVHHGTKSHMTAENALSIIQYYPPISAITKSYADGKVPDTFNPFSRITELEAQLADAKSQWIPVSKRLPENNTRVFVVNKFGQRDMADVYEGAFENCWDIDDADETITHWMPLPAAPAIAEGESQ